MRKLGLIVRAIDTLRELIGVLASPDKRPVIAGKLFIALTPDKPFSMFVHDWIRAYPGRGAPHRATRPTFALSFYRERES